VLRLALTHSTVAAFPRESALLLAGLLYDFMFLDNHRLTMIAYMLGASGNKMPAQVYTTTGWFKMLYSPPKGPGPVPSRLLCQEHTVTACPVWTDYPTPAPPHPLRAPCQVQRVEFCDDKGCRLVCITYQPVLAQPGRVCVDCSKERKEDQRHLLVPQGRRIRSMP
jgi:hypothetical protein